MPHCADSDTAASATLQACQCKHAMCAGSWERGKLQVAQLGDSGVRLIRNGHIVYTTRTLQHEWNMPYQLGNAKLLPGTDTPAAAVVETQEVLSGDVIVMASDGFFDNVWDDDLCSLVQQFSAQPHRSGQWGPHGAEALATALVKYAGDRSRDQAYKSPWSVESAQQRRGIGFLAKMFPKGGKQDDITVVVAQLQA